MESKQISWFITLAFLILFGISLAFGQGIGIGIGINVDGNTGGAGTPVNPLALKGSDGNYIIDSEGQYIIMAE